MSITDPAAEPAQPDEGQGSEAPGTSPWEAYLTRFPEEHRDIAAEVLREQESNANKRFEEAADARKFRERYEESGVGRYDPEAVQYALQVLDAQQQNPKGFYDWVTGEYAKEHGLAPAQPEQQPGQADQFSYDEFGQTQDLQPIKQLLEEQLGPIRQDLEGFNSYRQQQEQERLMAEADKYVEGQVAELEAQHPDAFKDKSEYGPAAMIETFKTRYIETDPLNAIPRAFKDYQAFRGEIETRYAQGKADTPAAAAAGGAVNGAPENLSPEDRRKAAIQFMRESMNS